MNIILLLVAYGVSILNPHLPEPHLVHAIYISVLEVDQGSIKVKVFANDLEDAIFNHSQQRLKFLPGNCADNSERVSSYFKDHLEIKINSVVQDYSYYRCDLNDLSIWLTFKFKSPDHWQNVVIKADYLMELFPTQSNVVSVTYQEEKRMFRLVNEAATKMIDF